METLPFEPLELVAIDPARNIRRSWQVMAAHDLFGRILVETRWGRIGSRGQRRVHSFCDEGEALRYVGTLLARRATAKRRLGVGYMRRPTSKGSLGLDG